MLICFPGWQHITLGNWMQQVLLSSLFILLKGLFNHTRSPPLRQWSLTWGDIPALALLLNELECAGWAEAEGQTCGPVHSAPAHPSNHPTYPPVQPSSPLHTLTWANTTILGCHQVCSWMNRHSHVGPGSVCPVCICACLWEGGRSGQEGEWSFKT